MAETQQGSLTPDKSGRCTVFDIPKNEWVQVPAVDAREMLKVGSANLCGPEVEMIGPAGRIKVNAAEVKSKEAEGYRIIGPKPPTKPEPKSNKGEGGGEGETTPSTYDFSKHTVAELKKFCEAAEIDHGGLNKAQLVSILTERGYDPRPPEERGEGEGGGEGDDE